jgi:SAM-dependent methyltransferase
LGFLGGASMQQWYEQHFQEDYVKIYAHRNDELAAAELEKIDKIIGFEPGKKLLDLCCGEGRHSRWFAKKGLQVVGVDLSQTLLRIAESKPMDNIRYVHSDMRHIQFREEFDYVVNLFTSFGYFDKDEENELVIRNISNALKRGGIFLFDYLNPGYLKKNLIPFSREQRDGLDIMQYRKINENVVIKNIIVKDIKGERRYQEKVKLYTKEKMADMFTKYGFNILYVFGDYDGRTYREAESPRMIFVSQKR